MLWRFAIPVIIFVDKLKYKFVNILLQLIVVEESSFYCARGKSNFVSKPKDKMRKEVASFKMIVNFKL